MIAVRCARLFDGERFRTCATVLGDDGVIVGVETEHLELDERWRVIDGGEDATSARSDRHPYPPGSGQQAGGPRSRAWHDRRPTGRRDYSSLADQLAAGVTTFATWRPRYAEVKRRARQQIGSLLEPTVVAAGPPITTPGGHCHFMGGVVSDDQSVRAAVVERVARRVDVIKVMTSGGGSTPGTDMLRTQFDTERLRLLVELSHSSGRPVAAHAHGLVAIEQAIEVGVDTIEHCSGMTDGGMELPDATLAAMAERGIAVSGIIPIRADLEIADAPKPVQEYLSRTGLTLVGVRDFRVDMIRRLHAHGVAVVTGLDSGLNPGLGHGRPATTLSMFDDAGLSSAAVLAAATSRAAEVCGLAQQKGRVQLGYEADLVVVDGDAQTNPSVAGRVRTVIRRGLLVPGRVG